MKMIHDVWIFALHHARMHFIIFNKRHILCVNKHVLLFIFFFPPQLYSLNEYKPPISKAKMTQITKSGIKAIKVSM